VALYNARHDRAAIRFNLINPATGNRIRMLSVDSGTGQEVERRDLVKGYEFKRDHYVLLSDEDFDSVKVESSSVMSVEKFVDAGSIDPMYYDASFFVAPDGQAGEDVYAVLREAISQTGKVALARVVISQRERTVALRSCASRRAPSARKAASSHLWLLRREVSAGRAGSRWDAPGWCGRGRWRAGVTSPQARHEALGLSSAA